MRARDSSGTRPASHRSSRARAPASSTISCLRSTAGSVLDVAGNFHAGSRSNGATVDAEQEEAFMTTTRRDVLKALSLVAVGEAMAPRQARADRPRVLGGAPLAAGPERSQELERLAAALSIGDTRQRGSLAIVWLRASALPSGLDV